MSRNYKFHNPEGLYFVSFATVYWIDVFIRRIYFDCVVENLNYCVNEKGMELYAWCIMPSHIHLVFRSTLTKPEILLGSFKSSTSKQLIKLIADNMLESRREWLLNSFKRQDRLTQIIPDTSFGSSIITLQNYGVHTLFSKR